jgi:hypothetical protein
LFKGYGAKICRLTTYVKAENRMVTLDSARFGNLHLIWQLGSFPYLIEK